MATYKFDYAIARVRDALNEIEGNTAEVEYGLRMVIEAERAYAADMQELSDLREQLEAVAKAEPLLDEEGKIVTWLEPTGLPFLEPEQGVSQEEQDAIDGIKEEVMLGTIGDSKTCQNFGTSL